MPCLFSVKARVCIDSFYFEIMQMKLRLFTIYLISLVFPLNFALAQVSSNLQGTYACMLNKNYGGFTHQITLNGANIVNQLFVLTFDPSGKVYGNGYFNKVNNFESSNNNTVNTTNPLSLTLANTTVSFSQDPSSPYLYKITDSSDPANGISYLAVANGGNTLFLIGAPTTTAN